MLGRYFRAIHVGRHGAHTLTPGTHLPLEAAGEHIGIDPNSIRYHEAIEELAYEGAIEWDESARYARGNRHHVITKRGLDGAGYDQGRAVQGVPRIGNPK